MKNPRFFFIASALVVLLAFAHLCRGSALGGESLWDGSFWNGGNADDDTVGWGDDGDLGGGAPDDGDPWGMGQTSRETPPAPPVGSPPSLPPKLMELRIKALAGDREAQFSLGLAYHLGRDGVESDPREAIRWYDMAAELGDRAAMANAAIILIEGIPDDGGERRLLDYAKGYGLLRNAAAMGFVTAQHLLGEYSRDGRGAPPDLDQAIAWYEKAGENGSGRSCDAVGLIHYERGDFERAGKWFLKGAALDHPRATFNAGVFYESGEGGFPKDPDQAFRRFLRASRLGYANGMRETGRYYLSGNARPADAARAKYWLLRARENGNAQAEELLAEISGEVQPFDDRPLRVTAGALIGEFAKDADAAFLKYEDRLIDVSGGNTNVSMGGGSTRVVINENDQAVGIDCDIPRKQGAATFNYGKGMVLRARFAGFSREKGVIRLENGETVPED